MMQNLKGKSTYFLKKSGHLYGAMMTANRNDTTTFTSPTLNSGNLLNGLGADTRQQVHGRFTM
jgi:hypothetical protein